MFRHGLPVKKAKATKGGPEATIPRRLGGVSWRDSDEILTRGIRFRTEPQKVRLDPPNLHNSVSNHLLRRYLDP